MLSSQPVEIANVIRRMRGGSQSFLVQASNGAYYVAKFAGNPQGTRTLINECLASHLLSVLQVATPDLAILRLDDKCQNREQLYFSLHQQEAIASGLHLGSKCPVNPDKVAIFDFLPRTLCSRVLNLDDVGVVFAFDHWVAHLDTRQFIFAHQPHARKTPQLKDRNRSFLTAWAIDNGMCFGKNWKLTHNKSVYPYPSSIYSLCDLNRSACAGARLIESLPDSELQTAHRHIPNEWFAPGDEKVLEAMLNELQQRKRGLVAGIQEHIDAFKELRKLAG